MTFCDCLKYVLLDHATEREIAAVDEEAGVHERPSSHNERSKIHESGDESRPNSIPSREAENKDEFWISQSKRFLFEFSLDDFDII